MKRLDYGFIFFFIVIIGLSAAPTLTYPLGRDQGEFATIAQGILDGKTPYVDLWNPKPPAIFYIYSWSIQVLGATVLAVRVLDFVILPFMVFGIYWLGLKLHSRAVAILAVAGFGAYYFTEGFWSLSQNDGIAMMPMLYCLICMILATQNHAKHWMWAIGAGILAGLTFWFKYPFALLVFGTALGTIPLHTSRRQFLLNLSGLLVGGLVVVGTGAYLLHQQGALDALIESAQVTSGYTRQSYTIDEFLNSPTWKQARETRWTQWRLLFGLMLVAIPQTGYLRKSAGYRLGWPIWGWWIGAWGVLFAQAKGYGYHWLPLLPPMLLIVAHTWTVSLQWLGERLQSNRRIQFTLQQNWLIKVNGVVSLALLVYLAMQIWPPSWDYIRGQESQQTYYSSFIGGEYSAAESQKVVNYLDERLLDGDSLYIYGFRAEVYYLTELRPATRFIFNFPLVGEWYPEEWRQENVDVLWAAQPKYVLILQADYMPWVTSRDEDSNTLLQEDTELNNWLIANYERETRIGNFLIWKHKNLD